jgi:hypothetical protein
MQSEMQGKTHQGSLDRAHGKACARAQDDEVQPLH